MGNRRQRLRLGAAALSAGLFLSVIHVTEARAAVLNLAPSASVTVSSQNSSTGQLGTKAIDGIALGYPADYTKEWATAGGKAGSWITLTWAEPVYVSQVKLYDRPNADDRVTAGTLLFTDGSSSSQVAVPALTNNGTATSVSFDERKVTSVTFRVDSVATTTHNIGLAEFEVFGSKAQAENLPPVADAGNAFSATVNTLVKLDGAGSADPDGSIASWAWSVVSQPSGSNITLTDANKSTPSFTPTVTGTYQLGLVVTDNNGAASQQATVKVTVTEPVPNQPPTANAGADVLAAVNTQVALNGAGSSDSDGSVASYQWAVVSSPAPVTLSSTTVAKPTFTPTTVGTYVFSLSVTDNQGLTSTSADQVSVIVSATPVAPANIAGRSAVTACSENTATGQTAAKAVDGIAQGYPADYTKEWSSLGGKAGCWIQLSWPTQVSISKVVLYDRPNTDDQATAGTLTFSDGSSVPVGTLTNTGPTAGTAAAVPVSFAPKNVTWVRYTVTSVSATTHNVGLAEIEAWGFAGSGNWPPTANAGPDQSIVSATAAVKLDGSQSSDPEGSALTYLWEQTSGTPVTLSSTSTKSPTFTAPTVTASTTLTFKLTVTDAAGQSDTDSVSVVVSPPASITAAASGMGGAFAINYDDSYAGRTATLQVFTIPTTMTTENPTGTWKNLGTVVLNGSGDGTVTVTDPYEVTHQYRAIVTVSGAVNPTNVTTFAAPRTTKNTGLATLYLDTNESVGISDRSTDREGTVTLVTGSSAPECTAVAPALAKMSGRGNSTWNLPKRPYKFSTDKKTSFCGIPAGKKWALIANYEDISLLRNMSGYWIGSKLSGLAWTPKYYPVDFYLNGNYRGQYLLIERITISSTRVNIDELKIDPANPTAQNSYPAISGGYLLEWNHGQANDAGMEVPDIYANSRGGLYVKEPDPKDGEATPQQKAYIDKWMDDVDTVLFSSSFTDPVNGWRKYIDEQSAIDFWIAGELTKNYGINYRSSAWMYKVRDTKNADGTYTIGKLYHGPLWDFDTGQGNADYGAGQMQTSGWWMRDANAAPRQSTVTWMNRLFQDPAFKAKAVARWKEVSPTLKTQDAYLASMQAKIKTSADLDHAQWGLSSFSTDAASLRSWLRARIAWIDANIDS